MIRQVVCSVVALGAITLLLESAIGQPAGTLDKVYVRDKKEGTVKGVDGVLKFAPTGFQIVGEGGKLITTVSPSDVVKVIPGDLPGVERSAILAQLSLEEKKTKKDYETARGGYADMLKKAGSAPEKSKQYLAYKLAWTSTKVADETADDEGWAALAEAANKEWSNFLSDYKTGWEIWPAARASTRISIEQKNFVEVARTWGKLTKKGVELPNDLKLEASLQEIDAQIRSGGYPTAIGLVDALAATPPGTTKDKLVIYARAAKAAADGLAGGGVDAAVKDIEEKIGATTDRTTRGVGYSMIGELYLAAKRPRDAMWAFLWVETVYNQDKDEVLKAMSRLGQLFKDQMEDDREKAYREKMRRLRAAF